MRPTLAADFFDWWMSSYRKKSRGSYGGNSLAGGGGVRGLNLLSFGGSVRFSAGAGSSLEGLSGGEGAPRIRLDLLTRRGTAHGNFHTVDARVDPAEVEAGVMSHEAVTTQSQRCKKKRSLLQARAPGDDGGQHRRERPCQAPQLEGGVKGCGMGYK